MALKLTVVMWLSVTMLTRHTESSPFSNLQVLSLEDLVPLKHEFYPERFSVQWISDSEFIYTDPNDGILKYNASSNSFVSLLDDIELHNLSIYSMSSFSNDAKYLLLTRNKRKVYRYSSIAEYFVYDLENKSLFPVGKGILQAVVWGKDRAIGYVQNNNVIYVPDAAQPESQRILTTDGVNSEVYNGVADWIYEEEILNSAEALWFSTNGTYLAVATFNDTNVEPAIYPYYGNPNDLNFQYPGIVDIKYPKAGRTNPQVLLRVFNLEEGESEVRSIPAPVDVVGLDHILGRVDWASDHNLVVLWLNRRQNVSMLMNCDLKKDKCDMSKEQQEPNGWIDISEAFYDGSGELMVDVQPMYNDDKRYFHATSFNFSTLDTTELSPGNATVIKILGWNQENNTVFYLVSPNRSPWLRQVWATSEGYRRCVSCSETACHSVSANFAPGAAYAVFVCSSTYTTPRSYIYNTQNDSLKLWRDNSQLDEILAKYKFPTSEFFKLELAEDVIAHVRLLLPPDMQSGQRYPMIVKVYAGPKSARVKDVFELDYSTYLAGNRSFIVCYVDVRGSGAMNVEALHSVNNALGTVEVNDTLHAIRELTKKYTFIDPYRIGVWGWSYGGFTTLMMLALDDRRTIACAAAVAPVTSWLYYDSIYTERYMDTPKSNQLGYKTSDLTLATERLRGKKFLLVHGSGDDNVHYQNSMMLAKKLQHSDIAFEQMSYTDENHSLVGVSRHLYHTLDHFWTECFA